MRPKKRVLVWDATERAARIVRLVVETRGNYAVEIAENEERIFDTERRPEVYLLIGVKAEAREAMEQALWQKHPWYGVVMVDARGIHPEAIWIAELLDKLKLATCRRRGPKPGFKTAKAEIAEVAA